MATLTGGHGYNEPSTINFGMSASSSPSIIYWEDAITTKKTWGELGGRSRTLIIVTGIVEVVLLAAALVDVRRRPADRINGPKWLWTPVVFVTIVGPLAYFAFGRRRSDSR